MNERICTPIQPSFTTKRFGGDEWMSVSRSYGQRQCWWLYGVNNGARLHSSSFPLILTYTSFFAKTSHPLLLIFPLFMSHPYPRSQRPQKTLKNTTFFTFYHFLVDCLILIFKFYLATFSCSYYGITLF